MRWTGSFSRDQGYKRNGNYGLFYRNLRSLRNRSFLSWVRNWLRKSLTMMSGTICSANWRTSFRLAFQIVLSDRMAFLTILSYAASQGHACFEHGALKLVCQHLMVTRS